MRNRVLITERLDDVCAAWLAERVDVVWVDHADPAALAAELPGADGMVVRTYTQVDAAMLAKAPRLRVVGRAGVGLDNFDLPTCRAAGVTVVHTPDANTQAVVEYVMGLMLDHVRPRTALAPPPETGESDAEYAKRFHELRKTEVGRQLDEMTLGIVGFGRIGKRLGRAAAALGVRVLVTDVLPEAELRDAVRKGGDYPYAFVDAATLFRGSDVVSVHVDGRPENRGIIGAAALGAMRGDVLFINAARGALVDHAALAAWFATHPRARAMLDVHDPEPPRVDSPLHGLGNVTLLPHLASRTGTALSNMSWVVRDVVEVLAGRPPLYPA